MHAPTVTYEQSILGAILIDASCMGQVVSEVKAEAFGTPTYRSIFSICQKLFNHGTPIDPVTVLHEGGGAFDVKLLTELMEVTPTAANVLHHCKALNEANTLNRLAELGHALSAQTGTLEQAKELVADINGLLVERRNVGVSTAYDASKSFMERHAPDAVKPEYIPLGFPALNALIRASLGDFLILGGMPSAGKTLMCLQMALAMAQKYRVGVFSLETSREKLTDRIISHLAKVPLGKIKDNSLNDEDWAAITAATARFSAMPIEIISAAGMSFDDIQATSLAHRYQVIIVDYIQLIQSPERDRYAAVTKISMQLHTMCQRHGIACLGLSQLARPEKKNGKPVPPGMSSLRESGQLEQDADAVILLYHKVPNDNRSNRIVKVAKNKDGDRDEFVLQFSGATQTLVPVEETPGQHYNRIQKEIREASKSAPLQEAEWVQEAMSGTALPF